MLHLFCVVVDRTLIFFGETLGDHPHFHVENEERLKHIETKRLSPGGSEALHPANWIGTMNHEYPKANLPNIWGGWGSFRVRSF